MVAKKTQFIIQLLKTAIALVSCWLEEFFTRNRDRNLLAVLLLDFEIVRAGVLKLDWVVKSCPCGKHRVEK